MTKHRFGTALLTAALMALAACAPSSRYPDQEGPLAGTTAGRLNEFTRHGWRFDLGERRAEIIENLGQPVTVDTEVVANRHRPEIQDTAYTLIYDGLEARIYDVTLTGKEILTHLTLTDARYETRWDLEVGTSEARVIRILGEPSRRTESKLMYEAGEPTEDHLTFFLDGDSVTRIEWRFYID